MVVRDGIVYDDKEKPIKEATIKLDDKEADISTNEKGEFYSVLTEGKHNLEISAPGLLCYEIVSFKAHMT
jgi:hypothetical protein